jgi:hypothetical protein
MMRPPISSQSFAGRLRLCLGLAVALGLALAGCGGGGSSDGDQITQVLRAYYERPAEAQCNAATTANYRSVVFGGSGAASLAACRYHQSTRAAISKLDRAVFVENIRVEGDDALAEVRAGGITVTESLVRSGKGWRLDDEKSPFTHPPGSPVTGLPPKQIYGPQEFGTPASFTNIPGISAKADIKIEADEPIDPGQDVEGKTEDKGRLGNDFGRLGPVQTLRYVNLPITLTNTGTTPFRGEVAGAAFDARGHEFTPLDPRDITQRAAEGRKPDWTAGEEKGIAPGASTTRYLTFWIPVGDRIVKWQVEPNALSGPGTIASMEPEEGVTYRKGAGHQKQA